MRTRFAWTLASLLEVFSIVGWAEAAPKKPPAAAPFPPYRLAGPAPAATVPTEEAPATAVPAESAPSQAAAAIDALAQQHYAAGAEMFNQGQYEAARVEFEIAYKILPLPDLLHNLSAVAERQGRLAEAATYEERFVAVAAHLTLSEREKAQNRIARLREAVGGAAASAAPGASAAVPGPVVQEQGPAAVPASPAAGGGTAPAPERRRTPAGAWALIGVGSGMLLGGIGCGIGAVLTQQSLENGQPLYLREIDALTERGQRLSLAGVSLDVAGGAVLVAGSAWAIWARTRK